MKEGVGNYLVVGIFLIIVLVVIFASDGFWDEFWGSVTGNVISNPGSEFAGNTAEEQECMQSCVAVGCEGGDMGCMTSNRDKCMTQCGAKPVAIGKSEQCVQECIDKNCVKGPGYLSCMDEYKKNCDDKCDMKGDSPSLEDMGAEELCISECVAEVDSSIRCGNSKEGETGDSVCQKCANQCVHLYEGPCLNDEKLRTKEKECETCEHCYGEPVEGASGEGWNCIVDVECKDASAEFGDNAGEGDASFEEGHEGPGVIASMVEGVGNVFEGIGEFFRGLFGGDKE